MYWEFLGFIIWTPSNLIFNALALDNISLLSPSKIKSAITDNLNQVKYDVVNQPGISNLITIYHVISGKSIADIEKQYAQVENYGAFKKDLIILVNDLLKDLQTKFNNISDETAINILKDGAIAAKKIASQKITQVKNKMEL